MYAFTNTIYDYDGAKPKAQQKLAQKMLLGVYKGEKIHMQEIGVKEGEGHLLEGGIFSGAYRTWH